MRNGRFLWMIIALAVLLDFYIFQAIKTVSQGASTRTRLILFAGYWTVSVVTIVLFALLPYLFTHPGSKLRNYLFATLLGLFFAKLLAAVFFLVDDIRRLIESFVRLFVHSAKPAQDGAESISRSVFMSWLGLGVGGSLFSTLIYGFSNKYNYKIHRIKLTFDNLPPAFKGLKILQLSDIHSGSFTNKQAVARGVDKALKEGPDLILFTGDLVNDVATEMKDYTDVFSRLKAPMGVFSTLGNHDYGDYLWWESAEAKRPTCGTPQATLQGEMGWRLLMNEHVVLQREGQQIALLGIENWSAKARFPKYGKMSEAYAGAEKYPFKILMSHDPSHWDAEVRPHYPDIDLALAGHTHGMQFGIEIPGLKWSPVQYVYKE